MKKPNKKKCPFCNGKGYYIGVIPPGKDVKVSCGCKNAKPESK